MQKIILIGAGGHAKVIVDTIEKSKKYDIIGFTDQNVPIKPVYKNYHVISTDQHLEAIFNNGVQNAFICIGFMGLPSVREQIYFKLKKIGYTLPVIIDPSAVLASDVCIGEGTYIGKNTIINADVKIGKMCIINTAAVIEHECSIQDFTHISINATICGQTSIGKNVFIGANATVIQNCVISDNCFIKAGRLIKE